MEFFTPKEAINYWTKGYILKLITISIFVSYSGISQADSEILQSSHDKNGNIFL